MARLNHPNLIGVFDFGDADGMPYSTLRAPRFTNRRGTKWSSLKAVAIVKGMARASPMPTHGIAHRDIKPANILLMQTPSRRSGLRSCPCRRLRPVRTRHGHARLHRAGGLSESTRPDRWPTSTSASQPVDQLLTGIDPAGSEHDDAGDRESRLDAIWRRATHPNPASVLNKDAAAMAADLQKWSFMPLATGHAAGPVAGVGGRRPSSGWS